MLKRFLQEIGCPDLYGYKIGGFFILIFIDINCSIFWYLPSSLLARNSEAESVFEIMLHRRRVLTQR